MQLELPEQEHPLDELLRAHAAFIGGSPALLAELRRPAQTATVPDLLVDRCEVTQGQFRSFANWRAAQVYPPPLHPATPLTWELKSRTEEHQLLGQLEVAAGGLSFHDAWAYCSASGGRLPSAAEFEAIAAGAEQRLYAWGDSFDNSAWPYADPSLNIAPQCGEHPTTSTPDGIHELGSSLLEWTFDETGESVLMGGNAWHRPHRLHALNFIRRPAAADFRSPYTGFRCVYEQPGPAGTRPTVAGVATASGNGTTANGASAHTPAPTAAATASATNGNGAAASGTSAHTPAPTVAGNSVPGGGTRASLASNGTSALTKSPAPTMQVPLPWGSASTVVAVRGGVREIGPPAGSRIVPLLRALKDENIRVLKQLPLAPATLDVQVMKQEVSRTLYARFLRDPLVQLGFFDHPRQPSYIEHPPDNWAEQQQQPEHPVTRVSWWSAWAFARWAGGELPTAEQWQILAGAALQRFPYGNEYVPGLAVDRNHPQQQGDWRSAAVTASQDASAHGIIGFGGNVAEWTSTSVLRGNAFSVVIKGGSFLLPAAGSQVAQTSEAIPDYRSEDLGFRLIFPPARR